MPDPLTVFPEQWRRLLGAAAELDLVRGGYYRARNEAIQIFAGPGSAPEGWAGGFPDGSPDLPRAAVGQAEVAGRDEENRLVVRFSVSNWVAVRAVKAAYERGDYHGRFQDYVRDQESALRGRPEDHAWLRARFERLLAHAEGRLLGNS